MTQRYSPAASLLLVVLCATVFTTNTIAARFSGLSYDPFVATFLRWAFVAVALTPYAAANRAALGGLKSTELPSIWSYAVLGLLLPGFLTFLAGVTTTAINMTIVYALTPGVIYAMVALLGVEKIGITALAGLLISTLGIVVFLYYQAPNATNLTFRPGDVFAILAVLSWSLYSAKFARKIGNVSLPMQLWLGALICTLLMFLAVLLTGRMPLLGGLTWRFIALAAFVALVPSLLGYLLHAHLTQELGASRVGLMSYLAPIVGSAMAILFLSEEIQPAQIAAAAVVLAGIWLASRPGRRPST